MDSKQKTIIVVAVVAVVIIAAAAAMVMKDDKDDKKTAPEVKFLIQDAQGVYFWISGNGDTTFDALNDAVKKFDIPFEASDASYGKGIQSMFGLSMTEVSSGTWNWWAQYQYTNNSWTTATVTMEKLESKDNQYMALVYGDGKNTPATTPSDAKVWDKSTKGTVFTIQSTSGLYFKVNGEGSTVYDAFTDAVNDYSIPFVASTSMVGIDSLFGLSTAQDASGNWTWWAQYQYTNGSWTQSSVTMEKLNSSENSTFAIVYGDGTNTPVTA